MKSSEIISAKPLLKKEIRNIRLLIWLGCLWMAVFVIWFLDPYHIGHPVLFWMLTAAFGFRLFRMLHEWYHYYRIGVPEKPVLKQPFRVDVLTTAHPSEPHEMIIRTLEAIQEIRYPHQTYLCDEGNDPVYKAVCERLGAIHVTRTDKKDAKAGNINNALRQATGDICLIIDPDHVPHPGFLDEVVPYFEDPEIGFVQVVQAYFNRSESMVAYGAAQQTYHFYGPMMMCMGEYGTAQAIGANCTFRRKALDSIGGHAAGLAEDMHTAMQLHAKGWKSVYVPALLSKGLVPATLASYYKQQLKWSRGTFELLVTTFIKLFPKFTWRQRIHYFTLPMHYLSGVINVIDILVPCLALVLAVFPWNVNLREFLLLYTPLLFISVTIRQYGQRCLVEENEKGLHLVGGVLRMGTWWIYLLGLVYTIFRKKVPYIPTPKDDKPQNNFLLSLPNILACGLCLGAIFLSRVLYGEGPFTHPYNLLMVGFALVNFTILGTVVLIGQERLMLRFHRGFGLRFPRFWSIRRGYGLKLRQGQGWIVNHAVVASLLLLVVCGLVFLVMRRIPQPVKALVAVEERNRQPFFTGIHLPDLEKGAALEVLERFERAMSASFSVVSVYQAWGPESLRDFPADFIRSCQKRGSTPMITWEPWSSTFLEHTSDPDLSQDRKVFKGITDGLFDPYLLAYAEKIRQQEGPIFIRFAQEPDNPQHPWSETGGNTPDEFVAAWRYVVNLFRDQGVGNVVWVWNPWDDVNLDDYYPGDKYVDWVGITGLNYGLAATDGTWHSFANLYEPFRHHIAFAKNVGLMEKPVMITEFGTTAYGGDQTEWFDEALYRIRDRYPEIKSVVFFYSRQDRGWATDWRPVPNQEFIDWTFADSTRSMGTIRENLSQAPFRNLPVSRSRTVANTLYFTHDRWIGPWLMSRGR